MFSKGKSWEKLRKRLIGWEGRKMAKFVEWVKKTVEKLIDPDKEKRVEELTNILHQGLSTYRQRFSLAAAVQSLEVAPGELEIAKENVYRRVLERAWADEVVTPEEQQILGWVVRCLEIPEGRAKEIYLEFARNRFAVALGQVMEDGILDLDEEARLSRIAGSAGYTLPQFGRLFFQHHAEAFLRGVFMAAVADGYLSGEEWENLLCLTQKFGLTKEELQQAIQSPAQQFTEHVLADAKSDGRLSPEEEKILKWLLEQLGLPAPYRKYVEQEMALLRKLEEIADGRLPTLPPVIGIELRAGELLHFYSQAVWQNPRRRLETIYWEEHQGLLALTDNRLVFSSATRSFSLGYRKIVSHRGGDDWVDVQVEGKPANRFRLLRGSPIFYPLFSTAVAMVNQTRVAKSEGLPTRHIPRDVRQRVWQRY